MPEGKLPPHDIDAEEAVIGSLLIDGTAINLVADFLAPGDFYHERNRYLYEAAISIYQRSEAINQITLATELNNRGRLEACGGAAYLSYLVSMVPTSLDIEHYASIVHRFALLRQVITVAREIEDKAYDSATNPEALIDEAKTLFDAVRPPGQKYLELSNLRIIKSKPPHYIITVNRTDLSITLTELLAWASFRKRVTAELDFIPIKPKNWDGLINKLLEQAEKREAPVDASPDVETRLSVRRFFDQRGEGTEYSDIQSGCYYLGHYRGQDTDWEDKEYYAFQPTPLLRWLKRDLGKSVARDALWAMMVGWGGIKHQWRVGKNESMPLRLWALPPDFARAAEYAVEKEERQEVMEVTEEREGEEELPDF